MTKSIRFITSPWLYLPQYYSYSGDIEFRKISREMHPASEAGGDIASEFEPEGHTEAAVSLPSSQPQSMVMPTTCMHCQGRKHPWLIYGIVAVGIYLLWKKCH